MFCIILQRTINEWMPIGRSESDRQRKTGKRRRAGLKEPHRIRLKAAQNDGADKPEPANAGNHQQSSQSRQAQGKICKKGVSIDGGSGRNRRMAWMTGDRRPNDTVD